MSGFYSFHDYPDYTDYDDYDDYGLYIGFSLFIFTVACFNLYRHFKTTLQVNEWIFYVLQVN